MTNNLVRFMDGSTVLWEARVSQGGRVLKRENITKKLGTFVEILDSAMETVVPVCDKYTLPPGDYTFARGPDLTISGRQRLREKEFEYFAAINKRVSTLAALCAIPGAGGTKRKTEGDGRVAKRAKTGDVSVRDLLDAGAPVKVTVLTTGSLGAGIAQKILNIPRPCVADLLQDRVNLRPFGRRADTKEMVPLDFQDPLDLLLLEADGTVHVTLARHAGTGDTPKKTPDHRRVNPEEGDEALRVLLASATKRLTFIDNESTNEGFSRLSYHTERAPTVNALLHALWSLKALHVRGPPFSGKTSLIQLLHASLADMPGVRPVLLQLQVLDANADGEFDFLQTFRQHTGLDFDDFKKSKLRSVLLIDEGQKLYDTKLSRSSPFWLMLKSQAAYPNAFTILFSSYPRLGSSQIAPGAPYTFQPNQQVGLRPNGVLPGLLLTSEEADELMASFEQHPSGFRLPSTMQKYLLAVSGSHIGLLKETLGLLAQRMKDAFNGAATDRRGLSAVDEARLVRYLNSGQFGRDLESNRAYPTMGARAIREDLGDLGDAAVGLCNDVLLYDKYPCDKSDAPAARQLIKRGVLVQEEGKLQFATDLFARAYFLDRFSLGGHLTDEEPRSLVDFTIAVLERIDPAVLQQSRSVRADKRLLERQWQFVFHSEAQKRLPRTWSISPDAGRVFGSDGFVDFYVATDDGMVWAVELLVEGANMADHERRFGPHGIYGSMREFLTDYMIVDFRTDKKRVRAKYENMWHVSYNEDYTEFRVHEPNGTERAPIRPCGSTVKDMERGTCVAYPTAAS